MRRVSFSVWCALCLSFMGAWVAADQAPLPTDATAALACIQNALGGVPAVAAVTSLRIKGEVKASPNAPRWPVAGTREIRVILPDRYQRSDTPSSPGDRALSSVVGIDRAVVLTSPSGRDPEVSQRIAKRDLTREMLLRLPGRLPAVMSSLRVSEDVAKARFVIDGTWGHGFRAKLFVDRKACVPVALEDAGLNFGTVHVELSQYRTFGGIRFPTLLTTRLDGQPFSEERVTEVDVNAPAAATYFRGAR